MKVLVVGGGAREHAILTKLSQSAQKPALYCAPGNAGIAELATLVSISAENPAGLADFAQEEQIDLTVVGPDPALMAGVVNEFQRRGLRVFGPTREAAMVEGSKAHAKHLMELAGIPTAAYKTFTNSQDALAYLSTVSIPIVIKADGLAAGKGVIVASSLDEAQQAVRDIMEERRFGESGSRVVIEEFMAGQEASVMAFVDGSVVKTMVPAQDHKPLLNDDKGPNTGGMGTYSPVPAVSPELLREIEATILRPMAKALVDTGTPFSGVLYAGLMLTQEGPKVVEFNARFGDPETQVVLPRLKNDILDVFHAVCDHRLDEIELEWSEDAAVCVVLAAPGYPGATQTGAVIEGLPVLRVEDGKRPAANPDVLIFHAGTKLSTNGNSYVTAGGRVLGVTALASTLRQAVDKAYSRIAELSFPEMQYRTDIAAKALDK